MTTGGSDYAKLCLVMGDSTDAIQLREQLVDACAQFLLCKQFGITTDINTFTSTNITFNDETENQRQQQQRLRRKSGYIYAFSSAIDDSLVIKQQVWASPDTLLYRYNPQTGVFPTRNCRLAESMIHFVLKQCRMHVDRPCSVFHGDRMAGYTEWFQSADWLQPLIRICCCSVAIALHQ
jgi:hypothetical protein